MKVTLTNAEVVGFTKAGKYSVTELRLKRKKGSYLKMSFLSSALNGEPGSLSIWVKDLATKIPCRLDDLDTKKLPVSELIEAGILGLDELSEQAKKPAESKDWSL